MENETRLTKIWSSCLRIGKKVLVGIRFMKKTKEYCFVKKRDIVLYWGGIALCMTSNFESCKNVGTVVCRRCTAAANRIDWLHDLTSRQCLTWWWDNRNCVYLECQSNTLLNASDPEQNFFKRRPNKLPARCYKWIGLDISWWATRFQFTIWFHRVFQVFIVCQTEPTSALRLLFPETRVDI